MLCFSKHFLQKFFCKVAYIQILVMWTSAQKAYLPCAVGIRMPANFKKTTIQYLNWEWEEDLSLIIWSLHAWFTMRTTRLNFFLHFLLSVNSSTRTKRSKTRRILQVNPGDFPTYFFSYVYLPLFCPKNVPEGLTSSPTQFFALHFSEYFSQMHFWLMITPQWLNFYYVVH